MKRNSFIRMSKLHDLHGRIDYISNPDRQEHLYATYSTADQNYWQLLAQTNQLEFKTSQSSGKCIEARELIIALPEYYIELDPKDTLKTFTDFFKEKYGVECSSALHHNHSKSNYHIHLIFSERKVLDEIEEKIATRNMFYDETGKHVRTKKEIQDENKNIRPGCRIIKKGEVYDRKMFAPKEEKFKDYSFLNEIKTAYTELINERAPEEKDRLSVFDRNDIYLPTIKIGKHNPKENFIREINDSVRKWNDAAEQTTLLMPKENIKIVKETQINQAVARSIMSRKPFNFSKIITMATKTLVTFTKNWVFMGRPDKTKNLFRKILNDSRAREKSRNDRER